MTQSMAFGDMIFVFSLVMCMIAVDKLSELGSELVFSALCFYLDMPNTKSKGANQLKLKVGKARVEEGVAVSDAQQVFGGVPDTKVEVVEDENEVGWLDDWEGVERTELDKRFGAAVAFVGCEDNAGRVSRIAGDVKMELYGIHKVAIEGRCREKWPMAFKVSARAKWNAWKQREDMSREEAMEKYVTLLSQNVQDWMGNGTSGIQTGEACVVKSGVTGVEGPNVVDRV